MTAPVLEALDVAAARAATDRLRLTLTDAHEQLIVLWARRAHEALNYGPGVPGWAAYCAAEFGELLNVLPTAEQLAAMADAGMPQRAIAAPFGVSLGKVNGRLRSRRAAEVEAAPATVEHRAAHLIVTEVVTAAGARGLTIPQVQRRLGWTYGAVSGALSRAERRGLLHRPADLDQRGGYRPYTAR